MIDLKFVDEEKPVSLDLQGENGSGTKNYNELENKPKINGVELQGDLTLQDLGIIVNAVKDVLINGATIVDKNGVASIPIASPSKLGVVMASSNYGSQSVNGILAPLNWATYAPSRTNAFMTYSQLDNSLKVAMCDGKGAEWTAEEKVMAQERIGLGWKLLGDITVEEDDVAMVEIPIDNPNYNEYQFFITLADRNDTSNRSMMVNFDGLSTNTYALSAFGVGTNKNYSGRGYAQRHCNSGWLTFAVGGTGNLQNATMATNASRANNFSTGSTWDTENPSSISVSLSTGLDIGTRFVVYAR